MPAPPAPLLDLLTSLGWPTRPGDWQVLRGGQTNVLWQVQTDAQHLVVKLYTDIQGTPLFRNSPTDEAALLRHLAPSGLVPQILHLCETDLGPCLIYRHQPGTLWHSDTALAARALAQLHHHPAPAADLPLLPGGSQRLVQQALRLIQDLPHPDQDRLLALRPTGTIAQAVQPVLLHGDPVPGNLIVRHGQICFIDWQCPALGDPIEDLAIFLSPAMQQVYRGRPLSQAEHQTFVQAYGDGAAAERLRALAPWHHWRMACYCAWKLAHGRSAYGPGLKLELAAMAALGA